MNVEHIELYVAAVEKRWADVTKLIKQGAFLTYPMVFKQNCTADVPIPPFKEQFPTALHYIAYFGDIAKVIPDETSIPVDVNVKITNSGGNIGNMLVSPLAAAVASGKFNNAEWLLKRGADITDKIYGNQNHPLLYVVKCDDIGMIRLLIGSGATKWPGIVSTNMWGEDGNKVYYAIHEQFYHYSTEVFKPSTFSNFAMVDKDMIKTNLLYRLASTGNLGNLSPDVMLDKELTLRDSNQNNLLHIAVSSSRQDNVRFLLNKCDLTAQNKDGNTPLHIAIENSDLSIIKLLVDHGVKNDIQNKKRQAPIHLSAQKEIVDIAKLLVETGVNLNVANDIGDTPLIVAIKENHDMMARYLITNGALSSIKNHDGHAPLHLAVMKKNYGLVKCLIANKCDVDITIGSSGQTALYLAIQVEDEEIMQILLENDATVNHVTVNIYGHRLQGPLRDAPLNQAVTRGTDILKTLLSYSPDLKVKNISGDTALHIAVVSGSLAAIEALLEAGIECDTPNQNNQTALDLVDNVNIMKVLIEHGATKWKRGNTVKDQLCMELINKKEESGAEVPEDEAPEVDVCKELECKVCKYRKVDTLLEPCRHLSVCGTCSDVITRCPICRDKFTGKGNVYLS